MLSDSQAGSADTGLIMSRPRKVAEFAGFATLVNISPLTTPTVTNKKFDTYICYTNTNFYVGIIIR